MLGLPIKLAPPSVGTPLRGTILREESPQPESCDSELNSALVISTPHSGSARGARFSKFGQILGDGALVAKERLEQEKQAYKSVVELGPVHS